MYWKLLLQPKFKSGCAQPVIVRSLLLLPGKAGNNRVVIRFQENTYGWLLPAVTLEAGKRYGYALSLGKEGGLILSGVSVRPWQEGEDYNGTIKPNK